MTWPWLALFLVATVVSFFAFAALTALVIFVVRLLVDLLGD